MNLKIGEVAPEFSLPDQNGKYHKLADYIGKNILLYFYPKDFTPGCTEEACQIRDSFPSFTDINAVVLGISTDSSDRHKKFAAKYNLPFTLLADTDKKIVKTYGVYQPKKFLGKELFGVVRTSFLIGKDSKILNIYEKVKPTLHAQEVLGDLANG